MVNTLSVGCTNQYSVTPAARKVGVFDLIVAGGGGRQHFQNPIGSAAYATPVKLAGVANHQYIGSHHGVDLVIGFVLFGQTHIQRCD